MAVTLKTAGPEASTSTRPDPRTLTTLPEILSALAAVESEEAEISSSLSTLLSEKEPIDNALSRLQQLAPHFDELQGEARQLSVIVSATAKTAGRVGGRVRLLDEEMRRVREAGERVGQVMELKVWDHQSRIVQKLHVLIRTFYLQSSLATLQSSMESQDWESATRHCARAMALPLDVISGPFAETAVVSVIHYIAVTRFLMGLKHSLLQRAIFRLHRRYKQLAKSYWLCFENSLKRPPNLGMLLQLADSSSYSLLWDGRQKASKPMLHLLWI